MVMRLRDLLLIALVLGAAGAGVYQLGRHVDSASSKLASHDAELSQHVYTPTKASAPKRNTIELAAVGIGAAAGVMVLISAGTALAGPRRRKTWRASH